MGKVTIFQRIKEIDLPQGEYIVVGGATMAAYNIREYGDIDIVVTQKAWEMLLKRGWKKSPLSHRKGELLWKDDVSIFKDFIYKNKNIEPEKLIHNAEMIHGYPFLSLTDLVKYKHAIGRPKDIEDIILIQTYLKQNRPEERSLVEL